MNFIQTGDICLGAMPEADKAWGRGRAADIRATFADIVRRARDEHADLLLIAGNLFSAQPSGADLRDISSLFLSVPDLRIVIAAGEKDRITRSSAVLSFAFPANVTILPAGKCISVAFDDIGTVVTGFSAGEGAQGVSVSSGEIPAIPEAPDDGRIHLFLASLPAFFSENAPGLPEPLLTYTYAAVGGSAKHRVLSENRAACAGSPEPLSRADTGSHGILQGTVENGALRELFFSPTARASYIPLTFSVTPETTAVELEKSIAGAIESRGRDNMYLIRIRGKRHPDEDFRFDALKLRYHIVSADDLSEPVYDFGKLFSEHPGDMIGFYIQALRKPKMSPVEKKALWYGIRALLETSGERRR